MSLPCSLFKCIQTATYQLVTPISSTSGSNSSSSGGDVSAEADILNYLSSYHTRNVVKYLGAYGGDGESLCGYLMECCELVGTPSACVEIGS